MKTYEAGVRDGMERAATAAAEVVEHYRNKATFTPLPKDHEYNWAAHDGAMKALSAITSRALDTDNDAENCTCGPDDVMGCEACKTLSPKLEDVGTA